jgi:ribonuclease HIII
MPDRTSYTYELTAEERDRLHELIRADALRVLEVPHTVFAAQAQNCTVALYRSGKCLIQGKGAADFVRYHLEPRVLQRAELDYQDMLHPERRRARIGVDESGKGDFFGPLVIATAFADDSLVDAMDALHVRDSKRITSDAVAMDLGKKLRELLGKRYSLVTIGPRAYNRLYARMRSVNTILAWGHARAIENLLEVQPDCPLAISDQFGSKQQVERALMKRGRKIELIQRHRAESDLAVAAASILARESFLRALLEMKRNHNAPMPKGASSAVVHAAQELVRRSGPQILLDLAKCHFKTADVVLSATGHTRAELGPDGAAVSRPSVWAGRPRGAPHQPAAED